MPPHHSSHLARWRQASHAEVVQEAALGLACILHQASVRSCSLECARALVGRQRQTVWAQQYSLRRPRQPVPCSHFESQCSHFDRKTTPTGKVMGGKREGIPAPRQRERRQGAGTYAGAAYGAVPGRGFALRLVYGSVAARRGAPCGQEVCDSLEETCVRCRRKRTTPVWVHQGESRKVRPLWQACQGGGRPHGLEVA